MKHDKAKSHRMTVRAWLSDLPLKSTLGKSKCLGGLRHRWEGVWNTFSSSPSGLLRPEPGGHSFRIKRYLILELWSSLRKGLLISGSEKMP